MGRRNSGEVFPLAALMKLLSMVPNLLTLLRLFVTPLLVVSLARRQYAPAFLWLVAAGITDVLDGWLARRFRWTSRFGAILDPLADKALLVGAYLALAMAGATPLWLTALVLGRDAAIVLFAAVMLAFGKRRSFPPSMWGKLSTLCQVATASFVIGARAFGVAAVEPWLPALFAVTAAATAWSGLHYAWQAARWREPRNPPV